jgi:transcriptional regulator with XRE-family HTH domain
MCGILNAAALVLIREFKSYMLMVKLVLSFGRRVRHYRQMAGLSQQALATAAGLSISVVTGIEQGQRDDPRLSTAVALARALNVKIDDLCVEEIAEALDDAPSAKKTRKRKES